MTAESPTGSTEKPHIAVGVTRKPDGELDYSQAAVPIGDTLTKMETEFAAQKAAKKAERDEYFAALDNPIAANEGTPDAVYFRIQKTRELNKAKVGDAQPDQRSQELDRKLELEQAILADVDNDSKNRVTFEEIDARIDSVILDAHDRFKEGSPMYGFGPRFGYRQGIDPSDFIIAASDLQERLRQEQDRARAIKMGSHAAKQTVEP